MSEVQTSLGIFEGKPGNLLFAYNQDALQQNKYYTAGKLTAWSILHNGPGIKCLNQHLFQKMCGCTIDLSKFDLETFHDTDVQHRLEKVLINYRKTCCLIGVCAKHFHIHRVITS